MKFKLYRQYGALNSKPVFDAVEQGIKRLGHEITDSSEDISVIWSVLWQGRMKPNQRIYQHCKENNKSILIIEVGNLKRGLTWRVSLDHINNLGNFGNTDNFDHERPKHLSVFLKPENKNRRSDILIACQHQYSLQWTGMPSMAEWCSMTIDEIKKYSDRPIVVRPHPRSPFNINQKDVRVEHPRKIANTYDDFDIDYNYHVVINHNSGPAVQAGINGIPVICDKTSLAWEISNPMSNIETASLLDRENWFLKLCHTEWTISEIASGKPLSRILTNLGK